MKSSHKASILLRNLTAVIILLTIAFASVGCEKKTTFRKGFGFSGYTGSIRMGMSSDTDIFDKTDVAFDLYYGIFDIDEYEKGNDPSVPYVATDWENQRITFALYICSYENRLNLIGQKEIADYKEIDGYCFVKEISEEEAFSDEYGYRMNLRRGTTYNHSEKIKISSDFFTEDGGVIIITLASFQESLTEVGGYLKTNFATIDFSYEVMGDREVKIFF